MKREKITGQKCRNRIRNGYKKILQMQYKQKCTKKKQVASSNQSKTEKDSLAS